MTGSKHIVVCGDSFCSYETDCKEQHFSQILQEKYGYRVTNLSKQGCSQVLIAYQVKAAIEDYNADVVIHNQTFPDRIDVKLDSDIGSFAGLQSFVYDNKREASSQYVNNTGTVKSTNLGSIDWLTPEKKLAVALCLTEIEDYRIKEQTVSWLHEYWHIKIQQAGLVSIPLLRDTNPGKLLYDFCNEGRTEYPTPFHTDEATQQLVAEQIDKIIKGC